MNISIKYAAFAVAASAVTIKEKALSMHSYSSLRRCSHESVGTCKYMNFCLPEERTVKASSSTSSAFTYLYSWTDRIKRCSSVSKKKARKRAS